VREVRSILATLFVGVLVVAAGCGSRVSPGGSGTLERLTSVEQFSRAFDGDSGHARLVLLLSPT
jgi:hypothetical protein